MYTDNSYGLEKVQGELLRILSVFHNYCRTNKVDYSVYAGTMLGAIREHGFIPWDDDVDIVMTMDNYSKLLELTMNDPDYYIDLEDAWVPRFRSRREDHGPFVDLFVFADEPRGIAKTITVFRLRTLQGMLKKYNSVEKISLGYKMLLGGTKLIGKLFPRKYLLERYWKIGYGKKRVSDTLYVPTAGFRWVKDVAFKKEKIEAGYTDICFENIKIEIFKEYDYMLVVQFGNDYMIPVKESERVGFHQSQIQKS